MTFSTRLLLFATGLTLAIACAWNAGHASAPHDVLNGASEGSSAARSEPLAWALSGVLALTLASLPSVLRRDAKPEPAAPAQPPTGKATDEVDLDTALAQLASQLAHDLRSPLAALQIVAQHTPELSEDRRLLMRDGLQRLNDIANNVLTHYQRQALPHSAALKTSLIAALVQSTVSERRVAAHKAGVELLLDVAADAYFAFADVDPSRFQRALAHLIDNAVEASRKESPVHLQMHSDAAWITFVLRDQGRGIAPEELARVLRGGTRGSSKHGLGLSGAQAAIQAFGGSLQLESTVGRGTTVHLRIPRADPAPWFAEAIRIPAKSCVLVLDDDDAIGRVWRQRVQALSSEHGIEVRVCRRSDDFMAHALDPRVTIGACLVDQDLLGEERSGLEMALELGLESRTTLITSHYEDPALRDRCVARHIKIVPKSYAAHVPLIVL